MNLTQQVVAEAVGTAFLLASVVGSGMMGERRAGGNMALALLVNTIATGAGLGALILTFGPLSGAQFQSGSDVGRSGSVANRTGDGYPCLQQARLANGRKNFL